MTKRQKRELVKIIITAVAVVAAAVVFALVELPASLWFVELFVWLGIYIFIGGAYLIKAVKNLFSGRLLDENFLMAVATIGAFCLGEYVEGVAVMLLYSVGELFQSYAVGKSRRSIASLADMRPAFARVLRGGEPVEIEPEDVKIGEIITVKPGEKIPLDGVVLSGNANINSAYITGESAPVAVTVGEKVVSGTVNMDGLLTVQVEKEFYDSTVSKILELVENSAINKSKTEKFITRFANFYTPAVVAAAVLLAVVPSIVTGDWAAWIKRALVFLVVSCPCALVISVPMTFFSGIGGASKKGILIKGADFLERLSKADKFVFDKTGTITSGRFKTERVTVCEGFLQGELLDLLLTAESMSNHPISASICEYCKGEGAKILGDNCRIEELSGLGVACTLGENIIYVGNRRLAQKHIKGDGNIATKLPQTDKTAVFAVSNGKLAGFAELTDTVKENVPAAISRLKNLIKGCKTFILSGDRRAAVESACIEAGIDGFEAELLPADKILGLEKIMAESKGATVYTGDGINDSPVLARCDVGIAMGGVGQDAAIEAADIVIMDDDIGKIPLAVEISKKTMAIVWENIIFALGVKFAVLVLAAFGVSTMWLAIFADVGVCALAIINAMRAFKI